MSSHFSRKISTSPSRSNKEAREGLVDLPNSRSSDNFIVKWNGNVNSTAIDRLLDSFEDAWTVEIDELGHPAPAGSEQYLFNIYIGDTGGNAPSSYGAAGYFTLDNAYYPMIVVANGTLESPEYADITAAHDFYHAIQAKTERYSYDESTPSMAMGSDGNMGLCGGLPRKSVLFELFPMFLPSYPVDYFNYPDTGKLR